MRGGVKIEELHRKASQGELVLEESLGSRKVRSMWTYSLDRRELCELRIGGKMNNDFIKAGTKGICCTLDEHVFFPHLIKSSGNGNIN